MTVMMESSPNTDDAPAKRLDLDAANALATENYRLVGLIVHRMGLPPHLYEDAHSAGLLGLIDASRKFDPGRSLRFSTYATPRIFGAVADFLRSDSPLTRTAQRFLDGKHGRATASLQRDAEFARGLRRPVSTDFVLSDSGRGTYTVGDTLMDRRPGPLDETAYQDRLDHLWTLMTQAMTRPEERLFALRHREGWTQQRIAKDLGLSESRIHQILRRLEGTARTSLLYGPLEDLHLWLTTTQLRHVTGLDTKTVKQALRTGELGGDGSNSVGWISYPLTRRWCRREGVRLEIPVLRPGLAYTSTEIIGYASTSNASFWKLVPRAERHDPTSVVRHLLAAGHHVPYGLKHFAPEAVRGKCR